MVNIDYFILLFLAGIIMNDKFFALKKEKQDRMINAALKVFACNGYAHASTDDIVAQAGISKGLLFHYFVNKIGLYSFVLDFSLKYVELELTTAVDKNDNDFFSTHLQIEEAKSSVMKIYPYMIAFLNSTADEDVLEALNEIRSKDDIVTAKRNELLKHSNVTAIRSEINPTKISEMIDIISNSIMLKCLKNDEEKPEIFYKEMREYLILLKGLSYK